MKTSSPTESFATFLKRNPSLKRLQNEEAGKRLFSNWSRSAEPEAYRHRLEKFSDLFKGWEQLSAELASCLGLILGGSSFLSRYLLRHPEDLPAALACKLPAPTSSLNSLQLRRAKYQSLLGIFAQRLQGQFSIEEEWRALSDLADRLIQLGLTSAQTEFPHAAPLNAVLLGKLGARELNVSSDIDFIFTTELASQEEAVVAATTRFAERHVRLLSEMTEEGFGYRVDLRLRPMGNQAPIVQAFPQIERYYESRGKTWERAAWLRARMLLEPGEKNALLPNLKPFIFRRHLGYGTIDDLREMKARVDASTRLSRTSAQDIKLGTGGIREIEFIVQALQLIYGGKCPSLQLRGTLETLTELDHLKLMQTPKVEKLIAAYRLLRTTEHAVQWEDERQTHAIPTQKDQEAWRKLAQRTPELALSPETVEKTRSDVQASFEEIFLPERRSSVSFYWNLPFDDDATTFARLEEMLHKRGVTNAAEAKPLFESLRKTAPKLRLTTRSERHFRRLVPVLMEQLLACPNAADALAQFLVFLRSTRARSAYYMTLAENPATLQTLLRLFGTSEFLSTSFVRHPELLDTLVMQTPILPTQAIEAMQSDIESILQSSNDKEKVLDQLREIKNEHILRIALHDLSGEATWSDIAHELTALAEALIGGCFEVASRDIPQADQIKISVIGMGSLGAHEMSYASDVDLQFIVADETTDMPQAIRWAQRFISALTLPTQAGSLYKVDTRLRPSGNQGMLVTTLHGFKQYHEKRAQLWERQSLLRARPMAGDRATGAAFEKLRQQICFQQEVEVGESIEQMRGRLENELGQEQGELRNIKLGKGGLADVEFLVAALQLRYGAQHTSLQQTSTLPLIDELEQLTLLTPQDSQALRDGCLFLRQLENRIRLQANQAISTFSLNQKSLKKVVRGFNLGPGFRAQTEDELLGLFEAHTERIRETFNQIVQEV